jgi:hypothetical protein
MIEFTSTITIRRPPEPVFDFLASIHTLQQAGGSPVLSMEKLTPQSPGPGFKYREVVQMFPFYKGEFITEIVDFDRPRVLGLSWTGPAMVGRDKYELTPIQNGTELRHTKCVSSPGVLRIMEPMMRKQLFPRLLARLEEIKRRLEAEA